MAAIVVSYVVRSRAGNRSERDEEPARVGQEVPGLKLRGQRARMVVGLLVPFVFPT
jgi:hypothetical protein